jgi:retinol dehydrogenase 14
MKFASIFAKPQSEGAKTSIYCCVNNDLAKHSGKYFSDSKLEELSSKASSAEDAERLWKFSAELVKLDSV